MHVCMATFSEEFLDENDFEAVLFCCFNHCYGSGAHGPALRQLRRLLQIKKIITNAPCVL